jgi:hypothetical protein
MTDAIIQRFSAGDAVPEWLLTCDPTGPTSKRPDTTFTADCTVVLARGEYWILPATDGDHGSVVSINGGQHISVSASAHTVAIPTQVNRLLRNE